MGINQDIDGYWFMFVGPSTKVRPRESAVRRKEIIAFQPPTLIYLAGSMLGLWDGKLDSFLGDIYCKQETE